MHARQPNVGQLRHVAGYKPQLVSSGGIGSVPESDCADVRMEAGDAEPGPGTCSKLAEPADANSPFRCIPSPKTRDNMPSSVCGTAEAGAAEAGAAGGVCAEAASEADSAVRFVAVRTGFSGVLPDCRIRSAH